MNASTLNHGTGQDPCPPQPAAGPATVDGVVFLRRQQASLLRDLRDGGPRPEPAPCAQAALHAAWLSLIGTAAKGLGPDAADRVARLYEYHGRVAGSLERQRRLPLPSPAARKLRQLLAARLAQLTDDAAAALTPRT